MKRSKPLARKAPMKRGAPLRASKANAGPAPAKPKTTTKTKAPKTRAPMKRSGPLAQRSEKMRAVYAGTSEKEGRRALVARLLAARGFRCEAGQRICAALRGVDPEEAARAMPTGHPDVVFGPSPVAYTVIDDAGSEVEVPEGPRPALHRCQGIAVDVHEVLARSAGGDILDEANCLVVCRSCHNFIGARPIEATALGLRASRYAGRDAAWARGQQ